jgi:hypothetical protein
MWEYMYLYEPRYAQYDWLLTGNVRARLIGENLQMSRIIWKLNDSNR